MKKQFCQVSPAGLSVLRMFDTPLCNHSCPPAKAACHAPSSMTAPTLALLPRHLLCSRAEPWVMHWVPGSSHPWSSLTKVLSQVSLPLVPAQGPSGFRMGFALQGAFPLLGIVCVCVVFCGVFLSSLSSGAGSVPESSSACLLTPQGPLHPLSGCSVKDSSLSLLSSGVRLQALPLPGGLAPGSVPQYSLIRMGDAGVVPVLPW